MDNPPRVALSPSSSAPKTYRTFLEMTPFFQDHASGLLEVSDVGSSSTELHCPDGEDSIYNIDYRYKS